MSGQLCPFHEHAPQTVEGWAAWDIALRYLEGGMGGIRLDATAALTEAQAAGHDPAVIGPLMTDVRDGYIAGRAEVRE